MRWWTLLSGGRARARGWLLVLPLRVFTLAALLVSCTPLRIQFPLTVVDADWMTEGGSERRDRVSMDEPLQLPIEELWIYNAGAGFSSGSPLLVGTNVIVGTRKGEVHAVDLTNGDRLGTHRFGESIEGAPAIADNVLFVPNAWGKTSLTAFDLLTGTKRWVHKGVPIEAPVLPIERYIIVGDVEGNVIAFDRDDGRVQWLYEFEHVASVFAGPIGLSDGRVVVANELGDVVCLELDTGDVVWQTALDEPVQAAISADDDRVFVPTTRGVFYALTVSRGEVSWKYVLSDDKLRFAGPAVSPDNVIFGGTDGVLRSLDPKSGIQQWTFQTDGAFAAPPVISGGLVFVGAMDNNLYALLTDNGSMQWSTKLRGRIKSAPAIRDGVLVVMSEPKFIYGFSNVGQSPDS